MRRYKIALIFGLLALSAAACGEDDGGGGVASADDGATASASADEGEELDFFEEALAYSECMRENGIEDFPDPEKQGEGGMGLSLPESIDPEDEDFKAAEKACEDLMPGPDDDETIDPELYEELIEYAECMRENGVEDFPDPEPNGGIKMEGDVGADGDFEAAQEACGDLRPEGGGEEGQNEGTDE